jgi:transposase
MNQARDQLSNIWHHFQSTLFPGLREEVGELTAKQQQLIEVIEFAKVELFLPEFSGYIGRPTKSRSSMARAFMAKAVYNMPTTEMLLDRLQTDIQLRRICGWEKMREVPSRATFSRAFAEFSNEQLAERIHASIIKSHLSEQLIGHISRDSTAIIAREKPIRKAPPKEAEPPKKRGRPKKGEARGKEPTRLERQWAGMSLQEMRSDLPTECTVGTKRNSKGYKTSWTGYKLHIDSADGGIPVSCLLSSASLHDSQVAIPLAEITAERVTSCYDLMDSAYDAPIIREHSESLGHVPIIDQNPRTKEGKRAIKAEQKRQRRVGHKLAESIRYNERSTVERVNGRLKDDFGARMLRVKGHAKVMTHLMFGVIVLTVGQLMRTLE